jgi:hypothetical protein
MPPVPAKEKKINTRNQLQAFNGLRKKTCNGQGTGDLSHIISL